MNIIKNISNFAMLTRLYAVPVSVASCAVVLAYAHYSENFSFLNFFLILIAICVLQMGANLFDDFIDVKMELKKGLKLEEINFNSRIKKAQLIIDGTYSFKQIKFILATLFLIPSLIGLYFLFISGWQILIFMALGGILTLIYPISARFYLSEIIIGLVYGPLIAMGGYFALTKSFDFNLFLLSFALFSSTLVLLQTHSIMDWEYDKENNKKTLSILSKSKENAIKVLKGLIIFSYGVVILGVINLNFNPHTLYVFFTLPIATKLLESIKDYINIKDVKFEPKWYYGTFENWKEIKEKNIAYFMYRFYLARNFVLYFALFLAIGTVK